MPMGCTFCPISSTPLLVSNLDSDMARPLDDAISTAFGTWHDSLQRTPFVDENGGDLQVINVCAFVMLGVGYGRLQHFLQDLGGFLTAESQQVERFAHLFPRIWSATKRAFWAEIRA